MRDQALRKHHEIKVTLPAHGTIDTTFMSSTGMKCDLTRSSFILDNLSPMHAPSPEGHTPNFTQGETKTYISYRQPMKKTPTHPKSQIDFMTVEEAQVQEKMLQLQLDKERQIKASFSKTKNR